MATIRNAMRFAGRPASCSALALTLAALIGLSSPGEARPISSAEANCIVQDVRCTDKCDSKGVFEKLCYAVCDAKLKACMAGVPSGPPDLHTAAGGDKAVPGNTKFPDGRSPAGGPPKANINAGGNTTTFLGSPSTNAGGSPAAGRTPLTSAAPGSTAIGTSNAIGTSTFGPRGAFGPSSARTR